MDCATLACRLLLGIVFGASAVSKLRGGTRGSAFRSFETAAREMGVPARLAHPTALAVVAAECAVLPLLALAPGGMGGLALSAALLAGFSAGVIRVLSSGRRVACACFGASNVPMGRRQLVRNAVLLAAAGTGLAGGAAGAGFPDQPAGVLLAVPVALVAAVLVIRVDDLAALLDGGPRAAATPSAPAPPSAATPARRNH